MVAVQRIMLALMEFVNHDLQTINVIVLYVHLDTDVNRHQMATKSVSKVLPSENSVLSTITDLLVNVKMDLFVTCTTLQLYAFLKTSLPVLR